MTLSVIVVNYNTRDLLRRCLASLGREHEVVVVDNASSDGSVDMIRSEFPGVRLLANARNVGFGAANNQGLDAMSGDVALLLNSDARATTGALERLLAVFGDRDVVAAGGRLVHPDGRAQSSAAGPLTLWAVFCEQTLLEKAFPWSAVLSPYWRTRRILARHRPGETHDVDQVMGACLALRPLERFDERFFLYVEDTDLCARLRRHGRIVYVPDAVFEHELGASSSATRWESVARYNWGKEQYFLKTQGPSARVVCLLIDRAGALLRLTAWGLACLATLVAVPRLRRQCAIFWRVLTCPASGPRDPRQPDS